MQILKTVGLLVALCMVSVSAHAVKETKPVSTDGRVRTANYYKNQVYKFVGHYGYQSSIEFAENEEIKTVSVGDSLAWQIVPAGNRLFLKPIEQDATTNMTVITDKRTYLFELHGKETDDIRDPEMIFILRFLYPQDSQTMNKALDEVPLPDLAENPGKYNMNYTITGPEDIAPIRIFDDGEFTYFEFRDKNAEVPAFFHVDSKNRESVINYRTRGDYIVLERVSARLTLRNGTDVVCVYNEAMLKRQQPKR